MTLVELLVVIGIITIVIGIVLPVVIRARKSSQTISCLSNLRQIGNAFKMYAADNRGILPPGRDTVGQTWEQMLTDLPPDTPYITDPLVFRCPADEEIYPTIGSSYDWRDTGLPTTTLAAHPYGSGLDLRTNPILAYEQMPGWHFKKRWNAVFLDGSAQNMAQDDCFTDLRAPIRSSGGS